MTCDFTGSHAQVPGPINCTWSGLVSGVRTVFKAITDPAEPATDGWFRPLTIICPPGNIFNAIRPAPVAAYFEATEMASDLVWHALAPAFPDRLPAGTFVSVCSTSLALTHPDTGEETLLVEPQPGGWGATRDADGQHGLVSVGDGETYTIPVEVAEQRYGVRVERFGFDIVPGAGAGRRRGGRGLVREYRICSDEALLTVAWGRHLFPPWGSRGRSRRLAELRRGAARRHADRPALRQGLAAAAAPRRRGPAGDRHRRRLRRPARARVRVSWPADLRDELVTPAEAAEIYGHRAAAMSPVNPRRK